MLSKYLLFLVLSFACIGSASAQTKPEFYYLADTINLAPNNRIFSIVPEFSAKSYIFYSRCFGIKNDVYASFYYKIPSGGEETLNTLPKGKYLSWQELEEMLNAKKHNFDGFYSLIIVEKLPGGKFIKNKVWTPKLTKE